VCPVCFDRGMKAHEIFHYRPANSVLGGELRV
jgi:hypothetical protein